MKLRWLTFFLLFSGLGVILIYVTSLKYDHPLKSEPSEVVVSARLPKPLSSSSPQTRPPIEGGGAAPGGVTQPPKPSQQEVIFAEDAIDKALTRLRKGQVYHNVPKEMKVGVSETIEAGIAPEVTEKIRKELQGRGDIKIKSGVRFDPKSTEMKLIVQPDEFKVFEVEGGEQFVTASTPGKWLWRVTPLKSGDNLIRVKAIVKLNVPKLNITRSVEVEVFSETRDVKVNLGYSVNQFTSSNWKEILSLVIGSGSLASLVTWLIGRKDKREPEESKG
ncbi:hypothetical protein C7B65_08440 [Phormidesmis priestleyi ULC007]|uniref:Uncharacterized protein n=1 Tax=Phormidesmis priestleyi ULC007 TaxID=1920490 RepID=A0A2T1DHX9_9CYAN|nr:hypothetical protein [Phormidesmis priestleyi]PSB20076.1 hypothetical protein C7B65_08440 [Phormidesmis priestleyi ULC007]PZO48940.1 MAG: hypothetical protein DCF14_15455 [Phormidesmis priestleyi]